MNTIYDCLSLAMPSLRALTRPGITVLRTFGKISSEGKILAWLPASEHDPSEFFFNMVIIVFMILAFHAVLSLIWLKCAVSHWILSGSLSG